ncbi:hypothetical protein [Protofrankia sp. BMG5.30]|uniref:hypothetical protein n=1 Tax=Protofrankia sp. BMG5.30 TaxID=1834514 RepID=UPI00111567BA|nr:hypothetical protein [Protofrankia sp. BMG5.30]
MSESSRRMPRRARDPSGRRSISLTVSRSALVTRPRRGWRLAAGGWRLAAGGWRLAAGGWRLAAGGIIELISWKTVFSLTFPKLRELSGRGGEGSARG